MSSDNGQKGYINEDKTFLNDGNTLSFGQDTATVFYQEKPYFTGDKIKVLKCRIPRFGKRNAQFFVAAISRAFSDYSWGTSSYSIEMIKEQKVSLPVENGAINFPLMEKFIAELEAQYIAKLKAYLLAAGLSDYTLTEAEQDALQQYKTISMTSFNLKSALESLPEASALKAQTGFRAVFRLLLPVKPGRAYPHTSAMMWKYFQPIQQRSICSVLPSTAAMTMAATTTLLLCIRCSCLRFITTQRKRRINRRFLRLSGLLARLLL